MSFSLAVSLWGQTSVGAPCAPVPVGIEGWYDFDAPSGPSMGVAGFGPEAIWVGNPTPVPRLAGTALRFDGRSFVELANSAAFNYPTQNFSVNAWVRTSATATAFLDKRCFGGESGCAGTTQGWALGVSPTGSLLLLIGSAAPYFYEAFSAFNLKKVNDGEWHFVSVTVDRVAARVVFAIDPTSEADSQTLSLEGYSGAIPSAKPLRIGGDQISVTKFVGELDDVQLYGRALAIAEVLSVHAAGPGGQCKPAACSPISALRSLAAWYSFERNAGIVWPDRAGQNDYLAGAAESVPGQSEEAVLFGRVPAGGGLRTVGRAPELDIGIGNFTVTAWIRYAPGDGGRRAILDKTAEDSGGGYELLLDAGYLRFTIRPAGLSPGAAVSWLANRTKLDDGGWHHVAAVVNRSESAAALYVDGQLETRQWMRQWRQWMPGEAVDAWGSGCLARVGGHDRADVSALQTGKRGRYARKDVVKYPQLRATEQVRAKTGDEAGRDEP